MTENIKGYRTLDQSDIQLINDIKSIEENLGCFIKSELSSDGDYDQVLISKACSELMSGFMLLNRAVAKPNNPYPQFKAKKK